MKSPYFAISILQQPNVFKSKTLPPWMRSRMEWVLAAFSKPSEKAGFENNRFNTCGSLWNSESTTQVPVPWVKDMVSLFALSQRQRWQPRMKAWMDIHHLQNHQWCFDVLFTSLFIQQQILFEHCGPAWETMISKNRLCSTLRECRYGLYSLQTGINPSQINKQFHVAWSTKVES